MARDPEKHDIPVTILDTAENIHNALGESAIGRFGAWIFTGSSSPAYIQIHWKKQPQIDPLSLTTRTMPGDKNASRIPVARHWKTAAVLGASPKQLDASVTDNEEKRPAVAYIADGLVRVGVLPEDQGFGLAGHEDHPYYAVAMRVGRGVLTAALGYWLPANKELATTEHTVVLGRNEPISSLPKNFPGVPLV